MKFAAMSHIVTECSFDAPPSVWWYAIVVATQVAISLIAVVVFMPGTRRRRHRRHRGQQRVPQASLTTPAPCVDVGCRHQGSEEDGRGCEPCRATRCLGADFSPETPPSKGYYETMKENSAVRTPPCAAAATGFYEAMADGQC